MSSRHCAGVEVLHHHDGRPEAEHRHAVHERGRVVQRCGRQVDRRPGPRPASGQAQRDLDRGGRHVAHGVRGQLFAHTLGPTRRPRRVEHLAPLALVGDGRGRERRPPRPRSRSNPGSAPPTDSRTGTRDRSSVGDHVGHGRRRHEGGGAAVVEDVLHLGAAQVAVERGVVQPRALGRPRHFEVGGAVLHEDGDVVAGAEPLVAQQRAPGGWSARRAPGTTGSGRPPMTTAGASGRSRARVARSRGSEARSLAHRATTAPCAGRGAFGSGGHGEILADRVRRHAQ